MVAERNVAHYLNDPHYRVLFNEARDPAARRAGEGLRHIACRVREEQREDDPWRDPAMRDFSRFTMTHDLPQQKGPQPRLQVPEGRKCCWKMPCRICQRPSVGR